MTEIDDIDRRILTILQREANLSQRELADRVGLSQNACWRRVQKLRDDDMFEGARMRLSQERLGLELTVFVMVRTRTHSVAWARKFRQHVEAIPEVQELHRIGGDWDYMLKVVTTGMRGYDRVYQQLIEGVDLDTVTGLFSMERIFDDRPLPLPRG